MSANLRYWLWLQAALGEGARIKEIIREFGSAQGLYEFVSRSKAGKQT